jgi:ATP-binding cassette subfamily B protein/subfamily B ATP-binding cassette protein MsbA
MVNFTDYGSHTGESSHLTWSTDGMPRALVYQRAFALFRPFVAPTSIGVLLTLSSIAFNLLKPWPFKIIVDNILVRHDMASTGLLSGFSPGTAVLLLCGALVIVHLLAGLSGSIANFVFIRTGLRVLLELRTRLYAALQALSLKFHDSRPTTDSSFRVAYDSQSIQTLYSKGFTSVLASSVTLVSMLVIMLTLDWQLTLLSVAIVPFVIWTIRYYAEYVREASRSIQERESAVLTVAQEGLSSIRVVHAFGQEEREISQFRDHALESLRANLKLTFTSLSSALVASTLMAAGTALLYYVGSLHVLSGTLTLGELLVFSTYLVMLYQPIEQLAYTAWALEGAAAGAQRCFEVLDQEDEFADRPFAKTLHATRGHIQFDHVCFGYDPHRLVLQDINLEIRPGETVAFVGSTGAGKSTLLSLVPRFYNPTAGTIRIDGHDLRDLTKKSIRQHISIVLQETILFSTTIRENIAYGRPEASGAEIEEAAKRAQAHDFITDLPQGYLSQVGEEGCRLSVGQKRRIGIARAFLKNTPILLLDEPTSSLDPITEASLVVALDELMKGRTTLIVTHQIRTVHHTARIVVLDHGRIVEQGRGPDLLKAGGLYAQLYQSGHDKAELLLS